MNSLRAFLTLTSLATCAGCAHVGTYCTPTWSTPTVLRAQGAGEGTIYVESPAVVETGDGIYLLGSPTFVFPGKVDSIWKSHPDLPQPPDLPAWAGILLVPDGTARPIRTPSGMERIAAPRGVPDADGGLHVVFASLDSSTVGHGSSSPRPLWAASLSHAKWSEPVPLLPGTELPRWDAQNSSGVIGHRGRPTMIVPRSPARGDGVYVLQLGAAGWTALHKPISTPLYTKIAPTSGDGVIISYVDHGRPDGNAVFVRRSAGKLEEWSAPVRVSAPGTGPAYDPQLLRVGPDHHVLVWVSDGVRGTATLTAAESRDGGRSWRTRAETPLSGRVRSIRAVSGSEGSMEVLLGIKSNEEPAVLHLALGETRWDVAAVLSRGTDVIGVPSLSRLGTGELLAIWSTIDSRYGTAAPVTLLARHQMACTEQELPNTAAASMLLFGRRATLYATTRHRPPPSSFTP